MAPCAVVVDAPDPTAGHCWPMSSPETPENSQASQVQSLVGSLLLSPGSWSTQSFVCALQESLSPFLWKFCNQFPLAFKVKFPGDSQVPCRIPRWGNMLWDLELLQYCKNFFGIIVLQFVGHLLSSSIVKLMATSSKTAYAIIKTAAPRANPHLHRRCSNTVLAQSLWGLWVLVHKVCLSPLSVSGGNGV